MTAANCGIIHSGHFRSFLLPYPGEGQGKLSKLGVGGVVATSSAVLVKFVFAPKAKNIAAMYMKLPVYVIIVIYFHN